jgi:hypothetical protein
MKSAVDKFLAKATAASASPQNRASLIFGLDATGSRERTWDMATHVQAEMFHEVGKVSALNALEVKLVYYRGAQRVNAECKASNWMSSPTALASSGARPA